LLGIDAPAAPQQKQNQQQISNGGRKNTTNDDNGGIANPGSDANQSTVKKEGELNSLFSWLNR
jgi:hypothetical protein